MFFLKGELVIFENRSSKYYEKKVEKKCTFCFFFKPNMINWACVKYLDLAGGLVLSFEEIHETLLWNRK